MGNVTGIEWTDHTFNAWWGCTKVSEGCKNCYAEALDKRLQGTRRWGPGVERRVFGDGYWRKPLQWNAAAQKAGRAALVFCSSMADVFDKEAPKGELSKLWPLIRKTPHLVWQLLTKRPERILESLPPDWGRGYPNVWLGATVENRKASPRIEILRKVPAALRFLSLEPLLEDVFPMPLHGVGWIIVGGESGQGARPMTAEWVRRLVSQGVSEGIPVFFKQWGVASNNPLGGDPHGKGGSLLDGKLWKQFPDGFNLQR